jgi:hypothetical protein
MTPVYRDRFSEWPIVASHARLSRRVVGVTLDVRNLDTAVTRLESAAVPFRRLAAATGRRSVVVNPGAAHGIWLELRQQRRSGAGSSDSALRTVFCPPARPYTGFRTFLICF